jgi:hypothetical protein
MTVAITYYVRFKTKTGAYVESYAFQNFFVGETKRFNDIDHLYAPFGVTSGAGSKGGDRTDAALVAPLSPVTVNLFTEACEQRWLCEIRSVLLDPDTYEHVQQITLETWLCAKPEINTERAVLRLSSPLDAVDTQIPKRMLNTRLVGSLPSSGTLSVN